MLSWWRCELVSSERPSNFLDLDGAVQSLALLLRPGDGLLAHDASAPVTFGFLVLLRVAFLDGRDELGEFGLVLRADFGEGEDGGGLGYG